MRWTWLSLTVIQSALNDLADGSAELRGCARFAIEGFKDFENENDTDGEQAQRTAQKIYKTFDKAWTCLLVLYRAFIQDGRLTEASRNWRLFLLQAAVHDDTRGIRSRQGCWDVLYISGHTASPGLACAPMLYHGRWLIHYQIRVCGR